MGMTLEATERAQTWAAPAHGREAWMAIAYFGPLMLLCWLILPNNIFVDLATSFMLKNRLHATASEVAAFRLITAVPVYCAFAFGLARDVWNPFHMRDRGFLILFGSATFFLFAALAILPLSVFGLTVGVFLAMVSFRFVAAALNGLTALLGQEKAMSGRLAAVMQGTAMTASVVGGFAGGAVAQLLTPSATFALFAVLALGVAAFGLLRPDAVFRNVYALPLAKGTDFFGDLRRLVRHRPIYAPILMAATWNFAPGLSTPLQYYMTNTLHASDAVFGAFNGIFFASYLPTILLYAWLCRRVKLNRLIWWATFITVPQLVPMAFIHTGSEAHIWAVPMGLMGGLFVAAVFDLAMRSCPAGLQGSLMMLVDGFYILSLRASDVVGSAIYDADPKNGFLWCVIATVVLYAAILPMIWLIPSHVMANADGEPHAVLEPDVPAEPAAARI